MNKDFLIREYQTEDYSQICLLMEDFQAYLAALDSRQMIIVDENFGQRYVDETLKALIKDNGKFWVILAEEKIIAFAIGIIPNSENPFHTIGYKPKKEGIITELFVAKEYRGQGLGKKLITIIEQYFRENNCNYSRLAVMRDNREAHQAYLKMGFQDQTIEMVRRIG